MKAKPKLVELNLNQIEATAATQVRCIIDKRTVNDYAEAMLSGAIFPAMTVFEHKDQFILADGFHRLEAALDVGYEGFPCEVFSGTLHDALEYALSANHDHGLRRSNRDKRHAVEMAIKDPHWGKWSNVKISRLCHVDDKTVATVRKELKQVPEKVITDRKDKAGNQVEQKARKTSKAAKKPVKKNVDAQNRRDLMEAVGLICSMPFDGAEAVERLRLEDEIENLKYCRDWFAEAVK